MSAVAFTLQWVGMGVKQRANTLLRGMLASYVCVFKPAERAHWCVPQSGRFRQSSCLPSVGADRQLNWKVSKSYGQQLLVLLKAGVLSPASP